jgi:hypothetical protein
VENENENEREKKKRWKRDIHRKNPTKNSDHVIGERKTTEGARGERRANKKRKKRTRKKKEKTMKRIRHQNIHAEFRVQEMLPACNKL